MSDYDPNSYQAMTSRILQRLDSQDATLARIEQAVNKTNGRVTTLEVFRTELRAKVALVAGAVSFVSTYLFKWWLDKQGN